MEIDVTELQVRRMCELLEQKAGPYSFLSPRNTLEFFHAKYIANLSEYCDLSKSTLVDCGCGHGWTVLAFLLAGGGAAIGLDYEKVKLEIAAELARIMELDRRVLFCRASITDLPIADAGVDITTCIETLEHLFGGADRALGQLRRVTKQMIFISTPNRLSPIVSHDTRLPFAHWLPRRGRRLYARLLGRQDDDEGNTFVSAFRIAKSLDGFHLASRFLGFSSFGAYAASYPHYLPYIGAGTTRELSWAKRKAYALIDRLLERKSFYVLPSATGVFVADGRASMQCGGAEGVGCCSKG